MKTIEQIIQETGLGRSTIGRAARSGQLRGIKKVTGWEFNDSDVERWKASRVIYNGNVEDQLSKDASMRNGRTVSEDAIFAAVGVLVGKEPEELRRRAYALIDYVTAQRAGLGIKTDA